MEYCVYCDKPRHNKTSCCGEIHFEERPDKPHLDASDLDLSLSNLRYAYKLGMIDHRKYITETARLVRAYTNS